MNRQRGYSEDDTDTPFEWWVTAYDARVKARRAFLYGAVLCGVIGFGAGMAFGETITIGHMFINGTQQTGTTVTIVPSDEPGQLAVVTLDNRHVNQGSDNGDYALTLDGMTVGVRFTWDANPLIGSDRITLTPPAGITCLQIDCGVTVMEGKAGSVVLFEYVGF